jgi:hypothetical protein
MRIPVTTTGPSSAGRTRPAMSMLVAKLPSNQIAEDHSDLEMLYNSTTTK